MTALEILQEETDSLMKDIVSKYKELGMEASGNFEREIENDVKETNSGFSAKILGADYSQQLELGRNGGKQPPSSIIEKWIIDKGVFAQALQSISLSSLAFLIARKIGREGWNRKEHGGVELISQVVTEERVQDIINKVGETLAVRFSQEIILKIKEVA